MTRRNVSQTAAADALLLTRPQVARMLGISTVTVDRMRKRGTLRPVELFGLSSVLFRRADVESLVAGLTLSGQDDRDEATR